MNIKEYNMRYYNTTQFAILGALAVKPSSGYDVKKFLEQHINHFWKISYGQVYPSLKRLSKSGLASVEEQTQKGRPSRYLYTITAEGKSELRSWLGSSLDADAAEFDREVMLRMFFGRFADAKVRTRLLTDLKVWATAQAQQSAEAEKVLASVYKNDPNLPFWLLTSKRSASSAIALAAWCDQSLETLKGVN